MDSYIKIDFRSFSNRILSYPWGESYTFLHFPTLSYAFLRFPIPPKPAPHQTFLHFPTLPTRCTHTLPALPTFCTAGPLGSPCAYSRTSLPNHPTKSPIPLYLPILAPRVCQPCSNFHTLNALESRFIYVKYAEKPYPTPTKTGALVPA